MAAPTTLLPLGSFECKVQAIEKDPKPENENQSQKWTVFLTTDAVSLGIRNQSDVVVKYSQLEILGLFTLPVRVEVEQLKTLKPGEQYICLIAFKQSEVSGRSYFTPKLISAEKIS